MFEKNLNVGYLLDFYGELIPEKKRTVVDMYYNEDYSLSEIAEQIGISRQGVRDVIKKVEADLFFYEEKLGLAEKMLYLEKCSDSLCKLAERNELPPEVKTEVIRLADAIKQ